MAKITKKDKMVVECDGKFVKNYDFAYEQNEKKRKREERIERLSEEKPDEVQTCLATNRTTNHRLVHLTLTNEKRMFWVLLSELAEMFNEELKPTNGRPKALLSDLIFASALKLYTNSSGRILESDLKLFESHGLIKKVPKANTINDFLNCEATSDLFLTILQITALPLQLIDGEMVAMDSSGFGSYQYERWVKVRFKIGKDGKLMKHLWRNYLKAHIASGIRTHAIYSCVITHGTASDDRQAPELLEQLMYNAKPRMISADKAYSSYRTLQIIEKLGAIPIIPFKNNANPSEKSPDIWWLAYNFFKNHREEFDFHYRQRPQVEATFSIVKRKFCEFLRCKKFESQKNELLMKFICHNVCCLIAQIFQKNIDIDFKKTMEEYLNRKVELKEKAISVRKTKRYKD